MMDNVTTMMDNVFERSEKYGLVKKLYVELKICRSTFYKRLKSSIRFKESVEKRLAIELEKEREKIENGSI
ncbi:MAG: hypothetical protein JNL36_07600 [Candidatus Kapabacteria bacterium]|nr:hypothetical protein [Candidatus Kapabacteria bacterium]